MEELQQLLLQEKKNLDSILVEIDKFVKSAPEGTLRISCSNSANQYYRRIDPKDTCGSYLKRSEIEVAKALAQKAYNQRILPIVKRNRDKLCKFIEEYQPEVTREMYDNLSQARKDLVTPYHLTDDEYAHSWEEAKRMEKQKLEQKLSKKQSFLEADEEQGYIIYTEKREVVRSKSEKILADKLYMMQVPYIYEIPLRLSGYGYVKPDFLVLNRRTRKEYYWEHLGLMDQVHYCEKAIRKVELYEKNNLFSGKNLILTYETLQHPIEMKVVEKLIHEFLL